MGRLPTGVLPRGVLPTGEAPPAPGAIGFTATGEVPIGVDKVGLITGEAGLAVVGLTAIGAVGVTTGAGLMTGVTVVVGLGRTSGAFSAACNPVPEMLQAAQTQANANFFMSLSLPLDGDRRRWRRLARVDEANKRPGRPGLLHSIGIPGYRMTNGLPVLTPVLIQTLFICMYS
jgi:hypothetical protein